MRARLHGGSCQHSVSHNFYNQIKIKLITSNVSCTASSGCVPSGDGLRVDGVRESQGGSLVKGQGALDTPTILELATSGDRQKTCCWVHSVCPVCAVCPVCQYVSMSCKCCWAHSVGAHVLFVTFCSRAAQLAALLISLQDGVCSPLQGPH